MKILPLVSSVLLAAATPFAAHAEQPVEQFTFAYALDRSQLATEAGAETAYRDLTGRARAACAISGAKGLGAVDTACAADLVEKVVAASGSATLEARHAGASYAQERVIADPFMTAER